MGRLPRHRSAGFCLCLCWPSEGSGSAQPSLRVDLPSVCSPREDALGGQSSTDTEREENLECAPGS